jgi:protein-disulfide isomerase
VTLNRRARASLAALLALGCGRAATAAPPPDQDAAPAAASAPAPLPPRMTAPEFRLGNPKAKVTVIEYASDTCPHCARFAAEVFPSFRKKWVDTGKVLYILREFPTDPAPLSLAGFVVARCAGEAKYLDVVNALFAAQTTAQTGKDFLLAGAKAGGLDEAQLRACLGDEAALKEAEARARKAADEDKITGTPTIMVNGVALPSGDKTIAQLDAAIVALLPPVRGKKHRG